MFGPDQPVVLQLLELPYAEAALKGLVLELRDGAFPLLDDIIDTLKPEEAFDQADAAILVGAKPRTEGMERKDLLSQNAKIFEEQGKVIDKVAKKNIKVLVVGNPANTNALICLKNAPSIPAVNFTAMTRLDHNRAYGLISEKTKVKVSQIENIIIWGNHSSTQYPDVEHATINKDGNKETIKQTINDDNWIQNDFIERI